MSAQGGPVTFQAMGRDQQGRDVLVTFQIEITDIQVLSTSTPPQPSGISNGVKIGLGLLGAAVILK